MMDLISRVTHRGNVNIVLATVVVVTVLNANVGHGNLSIGALKSASIAVYLDMSWGLLISGVAHVASFLKVGTFVSGQIGVDNEALSELSVSVWDIVERFVQPVGVTNLGQGRVPNAIGSCRQESPTVVGGKCFGVSIPGNENESESTVVGEFLQFVNGGGEFTASVVRGKLLGGVVPDRFVVKAGQFEDSNRQGRGVGGRMLHVASRCNQGGKAIVLSSRGIRHGQCGDKRRLVQGLQSG